MAHTPLSISRSVTTDARSGGFGRESGTQPGAAADLRQHSGGRVALSSRTLPGTDSALAAAGPILSPHLPIASGTMRLLGGSQHAAPVRAAALSTAQGTARGSGRGTDHNTSSARADSRQTSTFARRTDRAAGRDPSRLQQARGSARRA